MNFDDKLQQEKHLGYNLQRIREMLGMKQSALADNVGMSQQNISKLESSADIPEDTLEKLAVGLGINVELIKNFNEDKAIYNISCNFSDNAMLNNYPTIHPIEELKKLHEEKIVLYERMIKEKEEMMVELKKLINTLKGAE